MISAQTLSADVARESRYPLFRIMLQAAAPRALPPSLFAQALRAVVPCSFLMSGARNEVRDRLVTAWPVRRCAICRNIMVVRCLAEICAIIWPLLAAVPNIFESNGMAAIGWLSIALANSRVEISGRLCMPTWLRQ